MKNKNTFLIVILCLISCTTAFSQANDIYSFDKLIALSGDGGYDLLTIDSINNHLFISHGTCVNIVDLGTEKEIGKIDNLKGCHGIAIDNEDGKGFISDGKANAVAVFDLMNFKLLATITITGKGPDVIIYDRFSKKIFAFNGDNDSASIIDPVALKQTGSIFLNGGPEFAVSDDNGKVYNNLEDKNSLNVINTKLFSIVNNYSLAPCGKPTALTFDKTNQKAFVACRENKGLSVVDVTTGNIITTLPIGSGADGVVYDPSTKLIFCSCGDGTTTIIKQESSNNYSVVQTIQTQFKAKTIALDLHTHKIYLSVANFETGTKNIIPGTFKVLVYKMN